jgi:hypothetical protein
MNEPRRLVDEGTALEGELLRAVRSRKPPSGASTRALAALGLLERTVAAGAAGGGGKVMVKAATTLAKWTGIGMVGGLCAIGAIRLAKHTIEPRPTSSSAETARAQAVANPHSAISPESETEKPAVARQSPPPSQSAAPSRAPSIDGRASALGKKGAAEAYGATPTDVLSLAPEIALLDAARGSLAIGNFDAALAALHRYERDFPRGQLEPEARYLHIEALLARGDREEAKQLARRFLASGPESVHAKRIRALLNRDAKP